VPAISNGHSDPERGTEPQTLRCICARGREKDIDVMKPEWTVDSG